MQADYRKETAGMPYNPILRLACGGVLAALSVVSTGAHAQVYKCTVGGRAVFSDQPCAPDAKPINVRPATGASSAGASASESDPRQINMSNNPQAVLSRLERDRRVRETEHELRDIRDRIVTEQAEMDRELAALRLQKTRANNNLAGATWEKSISEEMSAVVARYDLRIRALQDDVRRLEGELSEMRR